MEKQTEPGRDLRFLDLATVLLRQWRTVAVVAGLTLAVALAVAALAPPRYVASTTMVPFTSQSRTALVSQLPSGVAGLVGGAGASASDRLVGVILKSRTLADSLVARFPEAGGQRSAVARIVRDGVRTQRNPDGSLVVQVRARDPRLAARVANTYPVLLNDLIGRVSAQGALRKQNFLESQVATARDRLVQSEQRLAEFQRRSAAPDVDEQARQTLTAAATLQAAVYQQELEVAQLRRTATPDNPRLRAAEAALEERRAQLRRMTSGRGDNPVFVPLGAGGQIKLAAAGLLREVGQNEKVYESLTASLAEAQIDANNNLPVLTVLDPAAVPGGPTRSLPQTAVLAVVLGLMLGVAAAFVREALLRLRLNPDNAEFLAAWDRFRAELLPFGGGRRRRLSVAE